MSLSIGSWYCTRIYKQKSTDILVDNAGTGSWHIGEAPCENSIKVALLNGVDISKQKARQVKKDDFQKFDLVIALDDNNLKDLKNLGC